MTTDVIAGIDIGGTKIALALASTDGRLIVKERIPTNVGRAPETILDEALARLERMANDASARIAAIGCGCGGPLDRSRGLILSPPNLPGWDEFPIVEIIEEKFNVRIVMDNDANAAALGELTYGAGRGFDNIVYITISTGIGGGVIVRGEVVHGVRDGGGEVGHIMVQPDGERCPCGSRGCLEWLCSGTNIARRAKEKLRAGAASSMTKIAGGIDAVTTHTVVEAAREGDALAREIWDETIRLLSIGVGNIIVTLAPQAIIIGGGVSAAGDFLIEPLRAAVNERVKILPAERVQILQAALGGDSGIYGALILGQQALAETKKENLAAD